MTVSVYLADDHRIMRDGLRTLIEARPGLRVIGESGDGRVTVREVVRLKPDVVLLDIAMPGLNGIEAAREIRRRCPAVEIIILSMHSTNEHVYRALEAGARGYLLKECAGPEVIEAVLAAKAGRRYLSGKISEREVEEFRRRREAGKTASPLDRLSPREREILQLVVEGKSSAAIAKIVFLSPKTVETYRSRLMKKLEVADLPSLIRYAVANGLTPA
ncbi:MAG: response regulator transcription factor [Candidatus Aminicenantes bacterium]|nr:response regulator transcription factor [Candidatus Aminicenantes bacterium]